VRGDLEDFFGGDLPDPVVLVAGHYEVGPGTGSCTWPFGGRGAANYCPFCHHPYQQMKLSHWARNHGMGYLTAWRWLRADILSSARRQLYERHSARNRAKRILEAMCG
jgi:hypothetical protein